MSDPVQVISDNMPVAAVAMYGGAELLEIDATKTPLKYRLLIEQSDWDIYLDDYEHGRLAISDVKSFVEKFSFLSRKSRDARASGNKYQTDDYRWLLHGK